MVQLNPDEQRDGRIEVTITRESPRTETGTPPPRPDPIGDLRASLRELGDALAHYGQARADGAKAVARNLLLKIALGIVAAVAGVVFVVVALILLLVGLSGSISALFDAPRWVGYLIVGALGVGIPVIVGLLQSKRLQARWLKELKEKYASRR